MATYNHQEIEKKWQQKWEESQLYKTSDTPKNKKYILDMFPYPSGAGLHVGHPEGYTATDILTRYLRMNGHDVLHPMGWDAFGLPAENYAIKMGVPPADTTAQNVIRFREQIKSIGLSYDWSREVNTSSPEYYRWTQWLFLQLYKKGLAYKKEANVNWCPSDHTVLANEQVVDGKCERCGATVEQKMLSQWFFKITDYAERLLSGLETVDWPEPIRLMQKNWIGKSEGAEIDFVIDQIDESVKVFTTRPDTLFGATYLVLAPEHPLVKKVQSHIQNWSEVSEYIEATKKKTELQRTALEKDKTGVELKGLKAINPATKEAVPVWIADYVLANYGTGAIMAVPAHDDRDFEFAKKFNLPLKVVVKHSGDYKNVDQEANKQFAKELFAFAKENKINLVLVGGMARSINSNEQNWFHSDVDIFTDKNGEALIVSHLEKKGFVRPIDKPEAASERYGWEPELSGAIYNKKGLWLDLFIFEKEGDKIIDFVAKDKFEWGSVNNLETKNIDGVEVLVPNNQLLEAIYQNMAKVGFCNKELGVLSNSAQFNGFTSEQAKIEITKFAGGKLKTQYKLRDWLVSRQRYWGAPIPVVYCEDCGEQGVPENELPVVLPTDVDFKPTGESPIARSKSFHNAKCPKCGKDAKRDSDTMDTFVDSSWYYFRYTDPHNDKEFASKEKIDEWLPVDTYVGGAEHAVLHLLYARFFTKVLRDLGFIDFEEPFQKLRNQGMILAPDGEKMSKSKGNVINPDEVIAELGADSLRLYEMFMGPLEDSKPWSTTGIIGVRRFLDKVVRFQESFKPGEEAKGIHKLIKKISSDIQGFKFNTAIAAFMEFLNENKQMSKKDWETFLTLLAPFAPHITEELWEQLGNTESIHKQPWPKFDESMVIEESVTVVVQILGKMRASLQVPAGASEDAVRELALADPNVQKHMEGKSVVKTIFVPNRLINFVTK